MSADLFAEFGASSSQGPNHQKATHHPPPAPASDPFSLFASSLAPSLPTSSNNPLQQWPSSRPPAAGGAGRVVDSGGSIWGDLGNAGGDTIAVANKQPSAAAPTPVVDDDGWGDFEIASPSFVETPSKPMTNNHSAPYNPTNNAPISFAAPPHRQPTIARSAWPVEESPPPPSIKRPEPTPKNTDPNVLFDADDFDGEAPLDEEEEDDFGDFETVGGGLARSPGLDAVEKSSTPYKHGISASNQLLSSPDPTGKDTHSQASFQERNPFSGLKVTTPKQDEFEFGTNGGGGTKQQQKQKPEASPSPVTAWPAAATSKKSAKEAKDDVWGTFDDFTPDIKPAADTNNEPSAWGWDTANGKAEQPSSAAVVTPFPGSVQQQFKSAAPAKKRIIPDPPKQQEKDSSWDWEAETPDQPEPNPQAETQPPPSIDDKAPPPTNIPPPSIILSLFPSLLDLPNEALYKPTAAQPPGVKSRVLSDPATVAFLRAYLVLATVAARVLAGRKHRWHRDKFLAQGMSISAAGGKGGGMKLAGVDKTQAAREDREAADVVAVWRANVGRLRAAVAAAAKDDGGNNNNNLVQPSQLRVPEVTEKPVVATSKNVPTAPKACVICGLKRDERVKAVDFEVEDSFGEWWVEHWGHRACRNFWAEHEAQLRQR